MHKIKLEYTDTAELRAKLDIAYKEASDNAEEAYSKCIDKFKELLSKANVKFHSIEINRAAFADINQEIYPDEFFKKEGPDGKLFKISNKRTKKFKYEFTPHNKSIYVQEDALHWYKQRIDEDYKRAEKFLNRKTVQNIIAEIKTINDNKEAIIERYNAKLDKAREIQLIRAEYKSWREFKIAVREEAEKLGYFAYLNNTDSFEFHKYSVDGSYSRSITAYATILYSKNKKDEYILLTDELLQQVLQPLRDAIKVDTSWQDKYKDIFFINRLKTKVNVHVLCGDRYYRRAAKEFSFKNFNEINFKNWLNNAEASEYSSLTDEVLKKARYV